MDIHEANTLVDKVLDARSLQGLLEALKWANESERVILRFTGKDGCHRTFVLTEEDLGCLESSVAGRINCLVKDIENS